jgi:hypothetical protein
MTTFPDRMGSDGISGGQVASRFPNTYCSQCGGEFGPGDHGYSHCQDHRMNAMTPANYSELANEHVVGVMLVEAIGNAIRRAQKACPTLDTGLFEDALSDFRGGLSTLNDELTAHEEGQF